MFGNQLSEVETKHGVRDPYHPLINISSGIKADTMILLLIPVYLLFKMAYAFFSTKNEYIWD